MLNERSRKVDNQKPRRRRRGEEKVGVWAWRSTTNHLRPKRTVQGRGDSPMGISVAGDI